MSEKIVPMKATIHERRCIEGKTGTAFLCGWAEMVAAWPDVAAPDPDEMSEKMVPVDLLKRVLEYCKNVHCNDIPGDAPIYRDMDLLEEIIAAAPEPAPPKYNGPEFDQYLVSEPATSSNKDTLSYSGSGKVSVSVSSIISSPKVQRQVASVREIAASQSAATNAAATQSSDPARDSNPQPRVEQVSLASGTDSAPAAAPSLPLTREQVENAREHKELECCATHYPELNESRRKDIDSLCDQALASLRIPELEDEVARLRLPSDETMSDHPGCVYCMEAGSPIRPGQVCPKCNDRLPTKREYEADELEAQVARLTKQVAQLAREAMVVDAAISLEQMTGSDQHATESPCSGCGKPLLPENAWMEDGCPCNTPAGVNNHNLYRWKLLHDLQQSDSREVERLRRELAAAQKREFDAVDRRLS